MWKALCLVTNSESPVVVVLSYVVSHRGARITPTLRSLPPQLHTLHQG
jgi:hypothetical protein